MATDGPLPTSAGLTALQLDQPRAAVQVSFGILGPWFLPIILVGFVSNRRQERAAPDRRTPLTAAIQDVKQAT